MGCPCCTGYCCCCWVATTVVPVVAGCVTITPPRAGRLQDAAPTSAQKRQNTKTAIGMTTTTIIPMTITAIIQPASKSQLSVLHFPSESQHSPVAQSLSKVHDFPIQLMAHLSSESQQDSPAAQSLFKVHDFPIQVVAHLSSESQQDSPGAQSR
jgi:hypothetical protein